MKLFTFGITHPDYDIPVLNEREVRAAAGILFLLAFFSFMNAFLVGNFGFIKLSIILFLVDFLIRLVINPRFSPSMTLGRLLVTNQKVEYSGAPQKRFAWALGLILALTMFVVLVIFNIAGPVTLAICILCLSLLFLESTAGICVGCMLYSRLTGKPLKLCPGGSCEVFIKEPIQETNWPEVLVFVVILFALLALGLSGIFSFASKSTYQPGSCLVGWQLTALSNCYRS